MADRDGLRTGLRIRERRIDLGIRQADLAAQVGISPSYLNLIEHNKRRIAGSLLADIARALEVEPVTLTDGANRAVLDRLRAAGASFSEAGAELARTEELAARYPGWAALIAAQEARLGALQSQVQMLTDRMAYDPALATALHAVISSVTSIRSTASILTGEDEIDADWQQRFHRNIHDDAVRLAASSEALIAYLEPPEDTAGLMLTPLEEMEAWLAQTGPHIPALEDGDGTVDDVLQAASTLRPPAQTLLRAVLETYAEDARALPLPVLARIIKARGTDPITLSQQTGVELARVMRRLIALPPDAGHGALGLATCDAGGFLTFLREVPGFSMPRGAACPLWPLFTALGQVGRPLRADVVLPGSPEVRLRCTAIAVQGPATDYRLPPPVTSTMLVQPDPAPEPGLATIPIGTACRICPREACPRRREPSALADGL